jgi:hypothetical protein
VYWLRRPPYLRWITAALLLAAGLVIGFQQAPTEQYPFAAETIPAGAPLEPAIDWRRVPSGLLPVWTGAVGGIAKTQIAAGDPLLPSTIATFFVPPDWWSVAIPLPTIASPGTPIRLVLDDAGAVVEGVLLEAGIEDGFETIGMVAFAPSDATRVAASSTSNSLVVMIGLRDSAVGPTG